MKVKDRRKSGAKKESKWKAYFRKLHEEKGVRAEDVAHDVKRSFSTVCSWKYGYAEPDLVVATFLERQYGIKVPQVA